MGKVVTLNLPETDLKVVLAALVFLRANIDDYNELREEFEEPTISEDQVNEIHENIIRRNY